LYFKGENMRLGKLSREDLERLILSKIERDYSVILPPKYGEDGAVIKQGEELIIVAADPITGASRFSGWLSVHVNANDIAVHAAQPKWFLSILLFPQKTTQDLIEETMDGIIEGCKEVGCTLVGGHTEITDRVTEAVIAGFMIGVPMIKGKFVTSSDAKVGDAIIMTKGAGIEGTFIICSDFEEKIARIFGHDFVKRCQKFREMISVLPDVRSVLDYLDYIHAMHDATEGGLLGGVYELSIASNVGFRIYYDDILIREETRMLSEHLKFNPLKLISSGTLIMAVDKNFADDIVSNLRKNGIDSAIIGEFVKDEREVIINGRREKVEESPEDELWRVLNKLSSKE